MAGGQERVLRRRIRSVQSTKKITRAMELIAATRIVKAQQRVQASRPYAEQITGVIRSLATGGAASGHPLLTPRQPVQKVAFLVIASDRGLCGGYNSGVLRTAERAVRATVEAGQDYSLVLVGKKSDDYFKFRKYRIAAAFRGFTGNPSYEDARQVAAEITGPFDAGHFDQVELIYTQFLSAGSQRVTQRRFMPMEIDASERRGEGAQAGYEFEPEPAEILASLLPRYVESRLYAALLEAAASEHAARQRAMKAATDNAGDLIKLLTRKMNRVRQEAITTEIMEIVGGAEALRQAASGGEDLLVDRPGSTDYFRDRLSARESDRKYAQIRSQQR